jgi:hypothetical protein
MIDQAMVLNVLRLSLLVVLYTGTVVFGQRPAPADARVSNVGLDPMKQLGHLLERTWRNRPEWGDLMVDILKGQDMKLGSGWWRQASTRYDWNWLRDTFDADANGRVDRNELSLSGRLGAKWFSRLDLNRDDQLSDADFSPDDPEGPEGATNRLTKLLFTRLDGDSNGRVTADELTALFNRSDSDNFGFLTIEDLHSALSDPDTDKSSGGGGPPPTAMLQMLFSSQIGWFGEGPEFGELAPDFTLPAYDGSATVTLSRSRGKKPVVLIFGSFT